MGRSIVGKVENWGLDVLICPRDGRMMASGGAYGKYQLTQMMRATAVQRALSQPSGGGKWHLCILRRTFPT
jgi:hypothetical protein